MITVTQGQRKAIETAALSAYPNEMAGLLTKTGFIHCENRADDPSKAFKISALDYARHHSAIIAVVHTHIPPRRHALPFDVRTPSYEDIVGQRKSALPWLIFGCDGVLISEPVQLPRVPNDRYLNRPFIWFINDCYSLVQDYYRFELDIILPDHKADKPYDQIRTLNDLFVEHVSDYGFVACDTLDGLKNGDLLLLDSGGFKRNHLGVVHDGDVLHQDNLSVRQPLSDFIGRINQVLKYAG